jgi:hypothetical protein
VIAIGYSPSGKLHGDCGKIGQFASVLRIERHLENSSAGKLPAFSLLLFGQKVRDIAGRAQMIPSDRCDAAMPASDFRSRGAIFPHGDTLDGCGGLKDTE